MKQSELIGLSDKELKEHLENEMDYLVRLRLNHAISPLDNPQKIVEIKRGIARMMTETTRRYKKSQSESDIS